MATVIVTVLYYGIVVLHPDYWYYVKQAETQSNVIAYGVVPSKPVG